MATPAAAICKVRDAWLGGLSPKGAARLASVSRSDRPLQRAGQQPDRGVASSLEARIGAGNVTDPAHVGAGSQCRCRFLTSSCAREGSNLHALRRWNLNPVRLPIPPLALARPPPEGPRACTTAGT
jgi:hypothetical protein